MNPIISELVKVEQGVRDVEKTLNDVTASTLSQTDE